MVQVYEMQFHRGGKKYVVTVEFLRSERIAQQLGAKGETLEYTVVTANVEVDDGEVRTLLGEMCYSLPYTPGQTNIESTICRYYLSHTALSYLLSEPRLDTVFKKIHAMTRGHGGETLTMEVRNSGGVSLGAVKLETNEKEEAG
jgi:hypothetical protein